MNKYVKLLKNSSIFAIANMGSHLISFALVRLYTEVLSQEQYGTIDFVTTTTSMLIPFLTLAIVEAVLRFSIGNDNRQKRNVMTNGLIISLAGSLLFCLIGPIVLRNSSYIALYPWMAALIAVTSINNVLGQFTRGIGSVKRYAIAGVLKTGTTAISNIYFLLVLKMETTGYLLALITAEVVSIAYLIVINQLWTQISFSLDKELLRQMILYSLPLMPSSLAWWVMNAADKYMLIAAAGMAANGIYAVAHKLPSLINLCNSLFFQAWQLSAVESSTDEDRGRFYSRVFNMLSMGLLIFASLLMLMIKPLMDILTSAEYGDTWRYTPFLILAMVFSAFSSFFGTNYVAMKKTMGALKTTLAGAIVNVVLNYVFIKKWGISGAAMATMISYVAMWLARVNDTREFVHIDCNYWQLGVAVLLLVIQAVVITYGVEAMYEKLIVCFMAVLLCYAKEVYNLCCSIKGIRHRNRV